MSFALTVPNRSQSVLFAALKDKLEYYQSAGKFQIKEVKSDEAAGRCVAKGTGFEAVVECRDNLVTVDLTLGLLLRPLRASIESEIRAQFEKTLGKL